MEVLGRKTQIYHKINKWSQLYLTSPIAKLPYKRSMSGRDGHAQKQPEVRETEAFFPWRVFQLLEEELIRE